MSDDEGPVLPPGTLIGQYEVVEFLGAGAMAQVFRVRHRELGVDYALKLLNVPHAPKAAQEHLQKRLLAEGRIQASVRHRNIVTVIDVTLHEERVALVMELVSGPDLATHIEANPHLSIADVSAIGTGILRGVRAAHAAGQLHRDLKPANILLAIEDGEWVPKVADFGFGKTLDPENAPFTTKTGSLMGTPAYMSPEQARDAKRVDERSDVFAVGCILYELLTGQMAFDAKGVVATMARIAAGLYQPVSELRPDAPGALVAAIEGALVVELDQRMPDTQTMLDVWTGRKYFQVGPKQKLAGSDTAYGRSDRSMVEDTSASDSVTSELVSLYEEPVSPSQADAVRPVAMASQAETVLLESSPLERAGATVTTVVLRDDPVPSSMQWLFRVVGVLGVGGILGIAALVAGGAAAYFLGL